MRASRYLLGTQKEVPHDAQLISHQLMLRAGLIRKIASGIYSWLPTGQRVLNRVIAIVRQEMEHVGVSEVLLPSIIPAELWQQTSRWDRYGQELLKITDRHHRDFCYGPTHEEVMTVLARHDVKSYKQLPLNFFQIQTKFRDEIRPRFGVMRAREFIMKDAYSFHTTLKSLEETYAVMHQTYCRIIERLGLKARPVIADSGTIGGETTHEFQVLAPAGEDCIFYSDQSDYAANIEKATAQVSVTPPPKPKAPLTLFDTPGVKTIENLARDYDVPAHQSIKTLVGKNAEGTFFALALRGDHDLNLIKVSKLPVMKGTFTLATHEEILTCFHTAPGSLGVVNCPIPIIVDRDAANLHHFVCGANQQDCHYRNVHWQRDVNTLDIADIRNVVAGDKSPDGRGVLHQCRGIEVGHIFQLGTTYSTKLSATVLDESGQSIPLIMGCYGFGITRIIAAAIEQSHDDRGIIWPKAMAPFDIAMISIGDRQAAPVKQAAQALYHQLCQKGFSVLWDDRNERPGVKFAEMDLIGIPHRVVISQKALDRDQIEYQSRHENQPEWMSTEALLSLLWTHEHPSEALS